jgi:hypothetical protein
MSILNRPSDGLFNVLIAIYKALAKFGPLLKNDVKSLVGPGEVGDSMVGKTMTRWSQLGLFREDGSTVSIETEYAPKEGEDLENAVTRLPITLRSLIFKQENNANFWDSVNSASADFTRGMAWLLAQDVYSFGTNSHGAVEKVESMQLADATKRVLQNDTRWQGLCHWANYLGFAWGGTNLVIDPTKAVRESLPQVFPGAKTIMASAFLKSLAGVLPVLDFGTYRQEVENVLDPGNWSKPPKFFLSTSLSRAVKRLELSGELTLEYRSDAGEAYRFLRQHEAEWGRAFTHVSWNHTEDC